MNPIKINTNDDIQQQKQSSKSSVILHEATLHNQPQEEGQQLSSFHSNQQLSILNQFNPNAKKYKFIIFWIFIVLAALILLTIIVRQDPKVFRDQCKVTDLVDKKISIEECEGILFKIRNQNNTRAISKNYDDSYDFKLSIDEMIKNSPFYQMSQIEEDFSEIKKEQCLKATHLIEVVHNVNFKGEFVFDHHDFYPSPQAKAETLFKLLQEEKQYFDEKYQISKYAHDQIGICVYIPSFNNAKKRLYLRNLDSVFQQEYQNYHIVYVNDASTDGTGDYVKAYMEENEIPAEKYVIINNEKNKGNSENVFNAGHNYCELGEIMVFLDGDDALIGRQVFSLLNAVYQKEKVALTYSQFMVLSKNVFYLGYSRSIPNSLFEKGKLRSYRQFFTSHLKTMYVDLFRQIKESDFQYDNGTFLGTASDVAYMTSAVQLAGTRFKFIKQINYEYHFDTGLNDFHFKQRMDSEIVYQKKPSKKLQSMQFADNPKTFHYI